MVEKHHTTGDRIAYTAFGTAALFLAALVAWGIWTSLLAHPLGDGTAAGHRRDRRAPDLEADRPMRTRQELAADLLAYADPSSDGDDYLCTLLREAAAALAPPAWRWSWKPGEPFLVQDGNVS